MVKKKKNVGVQGVETNIDRVKFKALVTLKVIEEIGEGYIADVQEGLDGKGIKTEYASLRTYLHRFRKAGIVKVRHEYVDNTNVPVYSLSKKGIKQLEKMLGVLL